MELDRFLTELTTKNLNNNNPTLEQVDAYDVPRFMPHRLVEEHGMTEEQATALIKEAKRMLYLSVVSGEPIAPSTMVDHAWHAMLMFTRFYKDYAEFIGGFIHHDPTPPDEKQDLIQQAKNKSVSGTPVYLKTKQNYKKYFHEDPDPRWWP